MISEAKRIAEEHMPGLRVEACDDLGDQYAFAFCGLSGETVPGTPVVCVDKGSGEVSFMAVPPPDILEAGSARNRYFEAFGKPISRDEAGSGVLFVEDEDGNAYDLSGLTDAQIIDKIERSAKAGVNLFFAECPLWDPHYRDDSEY